MAVLLRPTSQHAAVTDLGQSQWKEAAVAPFRISGLNYEWSAIEAEHCFNSPFCNTNGITLPALEYGYTDSCPITGGYVYRGSATPMLGGHYFYSDFGAGFLRSFLCGNGVTIDEHQ